MDDRVAAWGRLPARRVDLAVAGVTGAVWGMGGYAVLWGHTPVTVHRSFVVSTAGTVVLLPVRVVLWGIRFAEERLVGHPLALASGNEWIGAVAALVGAALVALAWTAGRAGVRRVRGRRVAG